MTENEREVFERVERLRARLERAKKTGQVELHLGLEDVELLVALSEIVVKIKSGKA